MNLKTISTTLDWSVFEQAIAAHPDICIWWRDDDVAYEGWWHPINRLTIYRRLQGMLDLLAQYAIPAFLAVVPAKFLECSFPLVQLLDRYNIPLALHGLRHKNRLPQGTTKCEFPPEYATGKECAQIIECYKIFSARYGSRLLPVFVPPFNTMADSLAKCLEQHGLIISASNSLPYIPESCCPYHTDYDFMDWKKRKLRSYTQILTDITTLVRTGRCTIGINSHHKLVTARDRIFFAKLFSIIAKNQRREWPFATLRDAIV